MNLQDQLGALDILSLIRIDSRLKKVANTEGGEYAGPCPVCGGQDRFRVWPNHSSGKGRFWCRQCGESGDALDYLIWVQGVSSFREGLRILGLEPDTDLPPSSGSPNLVPRHRELLVPPPCLWQDSAGDFVKRSVKNLWSPKGEEALQWLRARDLSDDTIQEARLGYNPSEGWGVWDAWGLEPRDNTRGVWLPRGVVVPWQINDSFWRINIRRPLSAREVKLGKAKYVGVQGSCNALYNADALTVNRPAILVEGEFDALAISQQVGDLLTAVATGSITWSRKPVWIARLALCSTVLIAYDADGPGTDASAYWLRILENARRWRPYWGDANAMAQDGVDLRDWIEVGLGLDEKPPQVSSQEQTESAELWGEADALLAGCDGSADWAHEWARLATEAGWSCHGMTWSEWVEDVARSSEPMVQPKPDTEKDSPENPCAVLVQECDNNKQATGEPGQADGWPAEPCRPFGTSEHRRFWKGSGGWVCATCHPPPHPDVLTFELPRTEP